MQGGDTMEHFVEFEEVSKYYQTGSVKIAAADHLNFYVDHSEMLELLFFLISFISFLYFHFPYPTSRSVRSL